MNDEFDSGISPSTTSFRSRRILTEKIKSTSHLFFRRPKGSRLQLHSHEFSLMPRQFHIRAYCVASGALTLYLFPRLLALFAAKPYVPPQRSPKEEQEINEDAPSSFDLTPHLTNTSLQQGHGDANVRLFSELIGSRIVSLGDAEGQGESFSEADAKDMVDQISELLADVFQAAINSPIHFQVRPFLTSKHEHNRSRITVLTLGSSKRI